MDPMGMGCADRDDPKITFWTKPTPSHQLDLVGFHCGNIDFLLGRVFWNQRWWKPKTNGSEEWAQKGSTTWAPDPVISRIITPCMIYV